MYAALVGWYAAAWIELIITQRYQPQYFVVTSIPVALMAAALAGHAYSAIITARGRFGRPAWYPVTAVALAIFLFGSSGVVRGVHEASSFTSVHVHAAFVKAEESGDDRTFGAALDLASKPGDPLLAWTLDTWPYLMYRRVSATRFIWKSFMAGEIWVGRTSPSYILAQTWKWFDEDVRQSKPVVFAIENASLVPHSPFTTYVDRNFTPVFEGKDPISYRNDVAHEILAGSASDPWRMTAARAARSGWEVDGNEARFVGAAASNTDLLPISADDCFRLEGTVDDPALVFRFTGATGSSARLSLIGDVAASGGPSSEFSRGPSGTAANKRTHFSLIVGRRAAAIVVGNRIRAVVELPSHSSIALESLHSRLALTGLFIGAAPAVSC